MDINSERLINTLSKLLSIHSPSGKELDCTDFLYDYFKDYDPQKDSVGNILVKIPGTGNPLMLAAHMDVVDPSDKINMVVKDGYVINQESCVLGLDNKSTIACFLEATEILKESNIPHRPLELIFTVEEETTGLGALKLDYSKIFAKEGIVVDSALPIGGIITASPFGGTLNISINGPTHHTKELVTGESTAWKTLSSILPLLPHGAISDSTNVNWSAVEKSEGGRNTVTREFIIQGEIRSFDKNMYDKVITEISKLIEKFNTDSNLVIFEHSIPSYGYDISSSDPWLQTIKEAMVKNGVEDAEHVKSYGLSDVNIFRIHNINIYNLSSGAKHTHTKDETISISDLETMTKIIISLCTT